MFVPYSTLSREQQLAWEFLRDSPTVGILEMKMPGLAAERGLPRTPSAQAEAAYFRRRLNDERGAARAAAGAKARNAHEALAAAYARQSVRAARQDALLDRALADTFPASDPVTASYVD